jgi:DNA polymerase-3 subunit epsilon
VEFAVLDFETTGLDYGRDQVVSFGVVPVRSGRVVLGEGVHQLVAAEVPASVSAMKIHRILPQDLVGAPSMEHASERLREALERRFVVAWFADVELAFLARVFGGRRAFARRTIDVRDLVVWLEGADPAVRESLSAAAARYGVPVADPHVALDDALVTAQLFLVVAGRLEGRGEGSVRRLLALSRRGRRS